MSSSKKRFNTEENKSAELLFHSLTFIISTLFSRFFQFWTLLNEDEGEKKFSLLKLFVVDFKFFHWAHLYPLSIRISSYMQVF